MEFELGTRPSSSKKIAVAVAFILRTVSFTKGLENSILFYEALPHKVPDKGIVVFYQPGCSHCIAEIPVIRKLVQEGYPVYAINALEDVGTASKFGVTATPTIVILPSGVKLVGEHDYNEIVEAYTKGIASTTAGASCGVEAYTCGVT